MDVDGATMMELAQIATLLFVCLLILVAILMENVDLMVELS